MATFARSFKPPSYLSPRLRPGMPGRSLSNSSDISLASNASGRSDDIGDIALSRPTTPGLNPASADDRLSGKSSSNASAATSSPRSHSRPIAIELPKMRKINSAPVYTPPEPLSARGDLPGGYFPLHEDPRTRVHRPHPFQHRATESHVVHADAKHSHAAPGSSFKAHGANMPVASYLAPGFHENPVPMGKYYPTNYEMRKTSQNSLRPAVPGSPVSSSSVKSDANLPSSKPGSPPSTGADDAQRKMQQYQRDMIMQAALALGNSKTSASQLAAGVNLSGVELRLTSAGQKPKSPRLVPLGSPGPVTPMELESSGGSYLDKGHAHSSDSRNRTNLAPPVANFTT